MAKGWDLDPSLFAGMIEEDVGKRLRIIAIQILNEIVISSPVDTGRFRANNQVSLGSADYGNNVQTQRCIGTGSPYAGANIPTTFTPSGSITLSWSKAAWEVWSKTLTGATVPFSFTLANDEGSYAFNFPKVQVSGDWPDGGNTDIIQVQLDITASDESPTITRQVTVPATAISVLPATSSGAVASTVTLTATLTPSGATDVVEWVSSNPSVATVASTGQKPAQG